MIKAKPQSRGIIITLVLVFGSLFLFMLAALLGMILSQAKFSLQRAAWENSLMIAEAGADYYSWKLLHNPSDLQDGQYDFYDNEGKMVGQFSLQITPKNVCGQTLGIQVLSTGSTTRYPNVERRVRLKYAATSVAEYSYLLDDAVWAGGDRQIFGKYHSNKGVRIDGTHNSLVTSAATTWLCTSSFGCSASSCPTGCSKQGNDCLCPGVFGASSSSDLWQYPVPPFDFNALTTNLAQMKTLAQSSGKYYGSSKNFNSQGKGYHLILKSNGKFDLKIITSLGQSYGYSLEEGWHWDYHIIQSEVNQDLDVSLSTACGLIFLEDNLWIEGATKGKLTVAAANLIDANQDVGVVFNNNLTYATLDGSDSLALVTEKDFLVPLYSPGDMILAGVFVSQKGKSVSRNHYDCSWYPADCKKNSLLVYGSVVSKGRVGTKWVYSDSSWASGYSSRSDYFDHRLANDPPPLLPSVSTDLRLISWEEVQP